MLRFFRRLHSSAALRCLLASTLACALAGQTTALAQSAHHKKKHHAAATSHSSRTRHEAAHHSSKTHHAATHPAARGSRSAERHHTTLRGRRLHRVRIVKRAGRHRKLTARQRARTAQLQHAFVASAQLRPMAQQLGNYRSPAAYAGVLAYARSHSGPAAEAAYLALGHAYLLDHRWNDALVALRNADAAGDALDDYANYFAAQADLGANQLPAAQAILSSFATKFPDSIFTAQMPVLQANVLMQQNQPEQALVVLRAHSTEPLAAKPDYLLALAKAQAASGGAASALSLYEHILTTFPLSTEAGVTQQLLQANGQWLTLPVSLREQHADALLRGGRYNEAALEFRALAAGPQLTQSERDGLLLSAATCDLKLRRLTAGSLAGIPDSNDDNGAHLLYLRMEIARNANDTSMVENLNEQLRTRFPTSIWLSEALLSSANMFMLQRDNLDAIPLYVELARRFPQSKYADNAHWRATWLTYRTHNFTQAAGMMDEQLRLYPNGPNTPAALYWRGRIYLDQAHDPATAAAYFDTVVRVYCHYYYAAIARERLAAIGPNVTAASIPMLDAMQPEQIPELTEDVPQDDPHLAKARLLANAGLNDYLSPEIHAAEGSDTWGSLAIAKLYASFGESYRAMRSLKQAIPFYTSAPIDELPLEYWRILYPQDYWSSIEANAAKNGLDPYMVASLIRQESEFNPRVISYANAWGLMQLLPSTGRQMARETGFNNRLPEDALLDPAINIRLGCVYLKQLLDKFGGHQEYAFAAYNAGDNRVEQWEAAGDYSGMDEFVESIPFTQTREYVQALMRNEEIYRELAAAAKTRAAITAAAAGQTVQIPAQQ